MKHVVMRDIAGAKGTFMDKDMARVVVKVIILSCISKKKTYPYALLKMIKGHPHFGKAFSKSDVYNMTGMLEKGGFIKSNMRLVGRKAQKMYTITDKGKAVVKTKEQIMRRAIEEFKRLIKDEFNE